MKAVYIDSSVAVSILLKEDQEITVKKALSKYDYVCSSNLFEAELISVAFREKISPIWIESLLNDVNIIFPDQSFKNHYFSILKKCLCRGADAYHIACAYDLDPSCQNLDFFTLDKLQLKTAETLGLKIVK